MSNRNRQRLWSIAPYVRAGANLAKEVIKNNPDLENNISLKQMAKYKYKYKNKKSSKSKKKGIIKKPIPRSLTPATKLIRCKASQLYSFTSPAAGLIKMLPVQANSVIDPFVASGAGRPLGYDSWSSLYRTAIVVGCKIKTTWWNNQNTAIVVGVSFPGKDEGTTALDDYEYYRETPRTNSRIFSPDVDHGIVVNKCSTKKVLGLKDLVDNNQLHINLSTDSDPSEMHYAHIWMQPMDQSSTPSQVPCIVDVEYIVLLTNPKVPLRS